MQENLVDYINQMLSEIEKLNEDMKSMSNAMAKHKSSLLNLMKMVTEEDMDTKLIKPHEIVPKGIKILVVDDDFSIRELLKNFLEMEGYEVHFAKDGLSGLDMVLKIKPDLIILDVMMPKMDGFEFCDTVYQDPLTRDIPIIMLSAKNTEDDIKTGYFVGAKGYLSKPFNQKDLMQLINNLLN